MKMVVSEKRIIRFVGVLAVTIIAVSALGCASVESLVEPIPPSVSVESVRLVYLDFQRTELVADLRIDNPNPISLSLAGFDYRIEVEGEQLVAGRQDEGVEIAAKGMRVVTVPVELVFDELRLVVASVGELNEAAYTLSAGVDVDIPILGRRTVDVTHSGTVPIPRLPRVRVAALHLDSIGLAGADLTLRLVVDNPNIFAVDVREFQYRFTVNDQTWVEGVQTDAIALGVEGESVVAIPMRLRFIEVGRGIYRLLTDADSLEFTLTTDAVVEPDHPLLAAVSFPLERSGEIPLRR